MVFLFDMYKGFVLVFQRFPGGFHQGAYAKLLAKPVFGCWLPVGPEPYEVGQKQLQEPGIASDKILRVRIMYLLRQDMLGLAKISVGFAIVDFGVNAQLD